MNESESERIIVIDKTERKVVAGAMALTTRVQVGLKEHIEDHDEVCRYEVAVNLYSRT